MYRSKNATAKSIGKTSFWKRDKTTQALLIDGARQVGKTTVIEEFGRTYYEHMVELNFIDNPEALSAVRKAHTADDLFMAIAAYAQDKIEPGKTLISSMKYRPVPMLSHGEVPGAALWTV